MIFANRHVGPTLALLLITAPGCTTANRDLKSLSRGERLALKTTFEALAIGTAWARVEGGKHYPSDVLFGAALGNFVAILVHDAFLPADSKTQFNATLGRRNVSFAVAYSF